MKEISVCRLLITRYFNFILCRTLVLRLFLRVQSLSLSICINPLNLTPSFPLQSFRSFWVDRLGGNWSVARCFVAKPTGMWLVHEKAVWSEQKAPDRMVLPVYAAFSANLGLYWVLEDLGRCVVVCRRNLQVRLGWQFWKLRQYGQLCYFCRRPLAEFFCRREWNWFFSKRKLREELFWSGLVVVKRSVSSCRCKRNEACYHPWWSSQFLQPAANRAWSPPRLPWFDYSMGWSSPRGNSSPPPCTESGTTCTGKGTKNFKVGPHMQRDKCSWEIGHMGAKGTADFVNFLRTAVQ